MSYKPVRNGWRDSAIAKVSTSLLRRRAQTNEDTESVSFGLFTKKVARSKHKEAGSAFHTIVQICRDGYFYSCWSCESTVGSNSVGRVIIIKLVLYQVLATVAY